MTPCFLGIRSRCLLGLLTLSVGCDALKKDEEKTEASADADVKAAAVEAEAGKAEAGAGSDVEDGDDAKAAQTAEVEGEEDAPGVTDCPEALAGTEKVDRVIKKECGTVKVTGDYAIEGATLTIEGGATLAFKDGAQLKVGYYEPSKLVVKGTKEEPVTFTSSGDKAAGVWRGLRLYPKAARSDIDGLVVEYAGDRDGAVLVDAEDVSFDHSTVRHAKDLGLMVGKKATLASFDHNTFEDTEKVAVSVHPAAAGSLGVNNSFGAGRVNVTPGDLAESVTWSNIGAPYVVLGQIKVDGKQGSRATLKIEPGAQIHFDGDGQLRIGYYQDGGLEAEGAEDQKIVFTAHEEKEPGAWRGIALYSHAKATLDHTKLEYGGVKDREGVLFVGKQAEIELTNSEVANNEVGVVMKDPEIEVDGFDSNVFTNNPIALVVNPQYLPKIGAENTFEGKDTLVELIQADIDEGGTWPPLSGAKVLVDGRIRLNDATVEIPAGATFHMKDGSSFDVGYYEPAALKLVGTAEQPVSFVGQRDDAGAWKGLRFYAKAQGNELRHVVVRNAGEKAGVWFDDKASGKVESLRCEKCSTPTLAGPEDKVEASGLEATEGTPATR